MNHRLLVNPGTPQAWEIRLRPGVNRVGRNADNDFPIPHDSISGFHCEITVSDQGVFLKDLGSTNGTFVNREPVSEARVKTGNRLRFGAVELLFESDSVPVVASVNPVGSSPASLAMPIPIPVPVPGSHRPPAFNPASAVPPPPRGEVASGSALEPSVATTTLPADVADAPRQWRRAKRSANRIPKRTPDSSAGIATNTTVTCA
jgi:predicted component of type VI protein secretion system